MTISTGLSILLAFSLNLPLSGAQETAAEPGTVGERRATILQIAQDFATVRWEAEGRHSFHGEDDDGVRVDTPDFTLDENGWVLGENVGMPYSWGGFTRLEDFEELLEADLWAGHMPKRGNAAGSSRTIGVDCSGLVSHCWSLPLKQSTRSLGALSYELESYDELLPGDIVNRFDAHVAMFTGWADEKHTTMQVIEAARIRVEENTYALDTLLSRNFRPMRYKLLDPRWQTMPPDNESAAPGSFVADEGYPSPVDLTEASFRRTESKPGDWARYVADEGELENAQCTWMAVPGAPNTLELQRMLQTGSDELATGDTLTAEAPWQELVAAFGHFRNPLQDLTVRESTATPGTYLLGDRALVARRIEAVIEGRMLSRSTLYPVVLEVEYVVSEAVPLFSLCTAKMQLDIDYGMRGEDRVIGRAIHEYQLAEFGREE